MPPRIAVIGGGVSGCALVHGLRNELKAGRLSVSLFEIGRGVGGRTATRRTRDLKALSIDHGAPAFSARTAPFLQLCESLNLSRLDTSQPTGAFVTLTKGGEIVPERDPPPRFSGGEAGIGTFAETLLRGGAPPGEEPLARTVFSTQVKTAEKTAEGTWRLSDRNGDDLGEYDWLVATSSGFAHPRWTSQFGGLPPLVAAAQAMGDGALDASLAALAPLTSNPVTACLMAFDGERAAAWAALPFFKASFDGHPTIARLVVRRLGPTLTAVVAHSTHDFARGEAALDVYGGKSAAARVGGAMADATRETALLAEMLGALSDALVAPGHLRPTDLEQPAWGPHLHRWGAAFPGEPLLAPEHALVPSARVAFSGDFVAGERAGSVEGAVLSGLSTAAQLTAVI